MKLLNNLPNKNENIDITNKEKVLNLIGIATRARKLIFGTDTVLNKAKSLKMLFVANNASDNTKQKIRNKCSYYRLYYVDKFSSEELSRATGKENLYVLGIKDDGFVQNLNNLLKEDVEE